MGSSSRTARSVLIKSTRWADERKSCQARNSDADSTMVRQWSCDEAQKCIKSGFASVCKPYIVKFNIISVFLLL